MLSKYPVALLGAAILIFLIVDRQSRSWLLRHEPYLAALIALILFSPVLLWNIRNGWISFAFQGSNRWTGSHHFGFHILIGSILLLLTPTGLFGIVRGLLPRRAQRGTRSADSETADRQYLWTAIFVLVPLSVFVVYSFINVPKLNWTAPLWLAAIPLLARDMAFKSDDERRRIGAALPATVDTNDRCPSLHPRRIFELCLTRAAGCGPHGPRASFWRLARTREQG